MWEVEYTDEFEAWWDELEPDTQESVAAAVEILAERGPTLGRPLVDTLEGSAYSNMKELRPPNGNIRILFAFDPTRTAILLIGGDKTSRWREWYTETIPIADGLYAEHIAGLRRTGQERNEQ